MRFGLIPSAIASPLATVASAGARAVRRSPPLVKYRTCSDLLSQTAYLQWFANTLFVSVASAVVSVFISYITAYAIIRLRFPGSEVVSTAICLAYIVPPAILFVPLATIIIQLHWFDKLWALVPIYATFLVPFCTWL